MANQSGNCVACGAPIFSEPVPGNPSAIPQTVFTCPCHKFLQQPKMEPIRFVPNQPHYNPPRPYTIPQPLDPYIVWSGSVGQQNTPCILTLETI